MTDPLRRFLAGVAAHGLPGAAAPPDRGGLTWDAIVSGAARERVTGHLVRAVRDGAVPASGAEHDRAAEVHVGALGIDLRLERRLLETTAQLEARGIACRVLKGPALAHTVYDDPHLRSFGDVDVLVRGEDFDHAVAALTAGGVARRRYPEPRPGFDARFGKGVCVEHGDGLEVDLHRSFVAGPFGLSLDPAELFDDPVELTLGGHRLLGLDRGGRVLHACYHAALGGVTPRLTALRDVGQLLLQTDVDVDALLERARRWRCGIVVQRAVRLSWETLDLRADGPLTAWSHEWRAPSGQQRALRCYIGPDRSYAGQVLAGAVAVPGWRAKVAYVRAMALPDASYLRARDGTHLARGARAVRVLTGRAARPRR